MATGSWRNSRETTRMPEGFSCLSRQCLWHITPASRYRVTVCHAAVGPEGCAIQSNLPRILHALHESPSVLRAIFRQACRSLM